MDEKIIKKDLKINARALGIPDGAAEVFIEKIVHEVKKSLHGRKIITRGDINRQIARAAKKYNADLSYFYQNRDTIV